MLARFVVRKTNPHLLMTAVILRALRVAPVALLGVLILSSACATVRPKPNAVQAVQAVVVAAARGADAVDTVWPGYRPFERGFIVFQPGVGAWLVAGAPPPAPWLAAASLEPRLNGRLYYRAGLALAPHRLVIEIVAEGTFEPRMSFSPGRGGIAKPAPSVVLIRDAKRASMTSTGLDVAITGRPIMIDGRGKPVSRIVVMLPLAAEVDGAAATNLASSDRTHRVTGVGTDILVRSSSLLSIAVAPGVVTVRLRGH